MKLKFFSVPANDPEEGQRAVNAFLSTHKVVTVEKNLVQAGLQSYWAVCVTYLEGEKKFSAQGKGKVDYRELLEDKDFAVFVRLRTLRKTLAEKEGVPAYALFTNDQLANMVQGRVTGSSGLLEIDGIGKGRLEKYGKEFLAILKEEFSETASTEKENFVE